MRTKSVRALCAVTVVLTTACQTWQPRTQSPTVVILEEQPERVRLRSVEDESWLLLTDPEVEDDSIAGWIELEPGSDPVVLAPIKLPATGVDRVEVMDVDEVATTVLVLGLTAVAVLFVAVLAACSGDDNYC